MSEPGPDCLVLLRRNVGPNGYFEPEIFVAGPQATAEDLLLMMLPGAEGSVTGYHLMVPAANLATAAGENWGERAVTVLRCMPSGRSTGAGTGAMTGSGLGPGRVTADMLDGAGPEILAQAESLYAADLLPEGCAGKVRYRIDDAEAALYTSLGTVSAGVGEADRFLSAQQGRRVGRVWHSSGIAVDALAGSLR